VSDGAVVKRNAPIIAARPGLIRTRARLTDRTKLPPDLVCELHVSVPGKDDLVLKSDSQKLASYSSDDLGTSFDFDVAAEWFTPNASITALFTAPKLAADPGLAFPADGSKLALAAKDDAPKLKVEFVPIAYSGDGTPREPTLDDAAVAGYRDALYQLYPISQIEVSVHRKLPWSAKVQGTGDGWNQLLNAVMGVRTADHPPTDTYYVGVLRPADSIADYCDRGCILGLAPQADLIEIGMRVAMIVGFGMKSEGGTLSQELAHAMGRMHAPCGNPQFIDPDYPYASGQIGVPGYDILAKQMVDADGRHDFMSYCGNVWTSDYTWAGIFSRMEDVAKQMESFGPDVSQVTPGALHTVQFDGTSLTAGTAIESAGELRPTPGMSVRWEDAAGHALGTAPASFRPYDNLPGGIVVTPEPPAGATVTRVTGLAPRQLAVTRSPRPAEDVPAMTTRSSR
jgi:hypothetical protein